MFGLAAAPEIVTALPSDIPVAPLGLLSHAYSVVGLNPSVHEPECSGLIVNDSDFLCCITSVRSATRFSVALTTCSGRGKALSDDIARSSSASKPVKGLGCR